MCEYRHRISKFDITLGYFLAFPIKKWNSSPVENETSLGGVMNIKLGHVMSSSRLICFVAFLAATFAWILKMPALFSVSALFLLVSAIVYVVDIWKNQKRNREA